MAMMRNGVMMIGETGRGGRGGEMAGVGRGGGKGGGGTGKVGTHPKKNKGLVLKSRRPGWPEFRVRKGQPQRALKPTLCKGCQPWG